MFTVTENTEGRKWFARATYKNTKNMPIPKLVPREIIMITENRTLETKHFGFLTYKKYETSFLSAFIQGPKTLFFKQLKPFQISNHGRLNSSWDSAKSAYLAQFLGSELTNMNWIIWKV
jgi:hypothetical protein